MEHFQENLRHLLAGEAIPLPRVDVVSQAATFEPLVKSNVCYLAAGVLINDKDEILMMQEAKRSCHGKWYLPAGRVEPGENLVDAARREVQEETGLEFVPTTMVTVEMGSGTWHRFTFTGRVTGGRLKTPADKDAESLQARWMDMETISSSHIELRGFDIMTLIRTTQQYRSKVPEKRHPDLLPAILDHKMIVLRMVLVSRVKQQKAKLLVNTSEGIHLPSGQIAPRDRLGADCCGRILTDAFGKVTHLPQLCGALTVEHCGIPAHQHDGLCYTLVYLYDLAHDDKLPLITNYTYRWDSLEDERFISELLTRIDDDRLVPFIDLH